MSRTRMGRKGVLITIATLLLFIPLIELASFATQIEQKNEALIVTALYGEKLRAAERDIAQTYQSITTSTITIAASNTSSRITFTNLSLSSPYAILQQLDSYETFLTGTFSNLTNLAITAELNTSLVVSPFNISITIINTTNASEYTATFTDAEDDDTLKKITLEATLSVSNSTLVSSSLPSEDDEDDAIPVYLFLKDVAKITIVKQTINLDPDDQNTFLFRFGSGMNASNFSISFGEQSEDIVFRIRAERLNATLNRLDYSLAPVSQPITVETSSIQLKTADGSYTKEGPLLLYGE